MKKFVSVLLAASALLAAAPALAQPVPGGGYERGYNREGVRDDLRQIERRIERGRADRSLSRREAERLSVAVQDIRRLERRYYMDGRLNRAERQDLENRVERLKRQVRWERNDSDNRRGDGGYRDGPRDRDRDGRPDRYEDDHGTRHDPR
jgi:hypothetical protein